MERPGSASFPLNLNALKSWASTCRLRGRFPPSGRYSQIRMYTVDQVSELDPDVDRPKFGFDRFIGTQNKPYDPTAWNYPGGGWLLPSVGTYPLGPTNADHWINATVDSFAAFCWYYAEELADHFAEQSNTTVPIGIVSSSWGGTMVEDWSDNHTMNAAGGCTHVTDKPRPPPPPLRTASSTSSAASSTDKATGAKPATGGSVFNPPGSVVRPGSLYNAMVLPWVNYTVRGAIWYQGENNVFQVVGSFPSSNLGDEVSSFPRFLVSSFPRFPVSVLLCSVMCRRFWARMLTMLCWSVPLWGLDSFSVPTARSAIRRSAATPPPARGTAVS